MPNHSQVCDISRSKCTIEKIKILTPRSHFFAVRTRVNNQCPSGNIRFLLFQISTLTVLSLIKCWVWWRKELRRGCAGGLRQWCHTSQKNIHCGRLHNLFPLGSLGVWGDIWQLTVRSCVSPIRSVWGGYSYNAIYHIICIYLYIFIHLSITQGSHPMTLGCL